MGRLLNGPIHCAPGLRLERARILPRQSSCVHILFRATSLYSMLQCWKKQMEVLCGLKGDARLPRFEGVMFPVEGK